MIKLCEQPPGSNSGRFSRRTPEIETIYTKMKRYSKTREKTISVKILGLENPRRQNPPRQKSLLNKLLPNVFNLISFTCNIALNLNSQ